MEMNRLPLDHEYRQLNDTRIDEQVELIDRLDQQLTINNDDKIEISADDLEMVLQMLQEQQKKEKKKKKLFNKYGMDYEETEEKENEMYFINLRKQKVIVNAENHRFYLNRTHLMVGAEKVFIHVEFWKFRDLLLPRGEAFLKGAHLYDWPGFRPEFWANTSNCFHAFTNLTWVTFPGMLQYLVADNPSLWEKWQVLTEGLQIYAIWMWVCTDMAKNIYLFVGTRAAQHKNWLNFTYAFLQNILSRVLSINNIYVSMQAAVDADDEVVQWFDSGRLFRILAIFPPIELEDPEEDWYFNVRNSNYYYQADPTLPSMTLPQPGVTQPIVLSPSPSLWSSFNILEALGKMHSASPFAHQVYHKHIHPFVEATAQLISYAASDDQNLVIKFPEISFTATSVINVVQGFAAGTAVIEGVSYAKCTDKFQNLIDSIIEVYRDYEREADKYDGWHFEQFDLWPYLIINDKIAAILYSIHGLSNGCYYSGFETYGALARYTSWIETPYELLENILNNFGYIYTAFRDIGAFLMNDGRTIVKDEYGLAVCLGQIYYYIFISRYFVQLTYTVNPKPLNKQTGLPEPYPGISIVEPPKVSGVVIISEQGVGTAVAQVAQLP